MKTTISKALSLLMALILVLTAAVPAFAAESVITYEGMERGFTLAPGSGYTPTDLFGNFKDVMPGDQLTEVIRFTNAATDSDYIRLYMRAVAHDENGNPLTYDETYERTDGKDQSYVDGQRDETVATMADFLAQLTMRVYNGNELIYEASPDQTAGLTENVFLGLFRSGEGGVLNVELEVPTTMGNEYAYRVGEVDWVFVAEAFDDPKPGEDETFLTVHKIWANTAPEKMPDSVQVHLLKDGKIDQTVTLNEENQWTHTWEKLSKRNTWTVEEVVPEGFTAAYTTEGNLVTIVNTGKDEPPVPPAEPVSLTVKKHWAGDEEKIDNRPASVAMTLYNGTEAVETVHLGDWNGWQYTWNDLDGNGHWSVIEVNIPAGYVPSYTNNGDFIRITNTASLIQTGQWNWPVPVMFGIGLLLLILGYFMTRRKRENAHG